MKLTILRVITWCLKVPLSALFMIAGSGKFGASSRLAEAFSEWGFPLWFQIIVGVLEIAGGLALLIPRVSKYGLLILLTIMVGATLTHFANYNSLGFPLLPVVLIVLLVVIYLGEIVVNSHRLGARPTGIPNQYKINNR